MRGETHSAGPSITEPTEKETPVKLKQVLICSEFIPEETLLSDNIETGQYKASPSLEVFKSRLDMALSNLVYGSCPCPGQGGWN